MERTPIQRQIEAIVTNGLGFYDTMNLGYDPEQVNSPEDLQTHLVIMESRDCSLPEIDKTIINYNMYKYLPDMKSNLKIYLKYLPNSQQSREI